MLTLTSAPSEAAAAPALRRLSHATLEDKVRGGWAGQMIGVSFGAPTEFHSNGKIIEGPIAWQPENVSNAIVQDDLYVEMTFAEVMDRFGLEATSEQYGEMFKDSKYMLWHANAAARRLLNRGIKAPWSGHPKYNAHANDIDFQIESDFIGLMTPGLPREANKYADRVGRVMNYGDGLYGGMFFAGMYAAAFFESDPEKVVRAGLLSIPEGSGYAKVIKGVLAEYAKNPADWKRTWQAITDAWDKDDPCPDGALRPFNIDARLNGAWVALGLLYGHGDFAQTLDVSTRAGQDSDCNPSSALGILGVILGYERIPDLWKAGIPRIATTRFDYTSYTFQSIVASTLARARRVIEGAGGTITATRSGDSGPGPRSSRPRAMGRGPADEAGRGQRSRVDLGRRLGGGDPKEPQVRAARTLRDHDRSRGDLPLLRDRGRPDGRHDPGRGPGRRVPRRPEGRRDRRVDSAEHERQRPLARDRPLAGRPHGSGGQAGRQGRALDGHRSGPRAGHRVRTPVTRYFSSFT